MLGSLVYAMLCIRLNFAYRLSVLSIYMASLGKANSKAFKWALRYVKCTIKNLLTYGKGTYDSNHIIKC